MSLKDHYSGLLPQGDTLFYSNISKFSGNLEVILDEVTYKTSLQNIHKIGWKVNDLKSTDASMLGHGCGVSQYPQFYDKTKNYQMLPRPYTESYSGEKGHQFLWANWVLALVKQVETFVMVSISDMLSIKYCQKLGKNVGY